MGDYGPRSDFSTTTTRERQVTPLTLLSRTTRSLDLAATYAFDLREPDGHWYGEMLGNITCSAEYIFLCTFLQKDLSKDSDAYCRYILSEQNPDGSWGLAPYFPGDVSTTAEAYLALKILGIQADYPAMLRARDFILEVGGLAKIRMLTRFFFAEFGLFPWSWVPQLPAEFILLPPRLSINKFKLSSWSRCAIVPLLIVRHHEPIFLLPNGATTNFVDELWLNTENKAAPYGPTLGEAWNEDFVEFGFGIMEKVIYCLGGLRYSLLRPYARRQCVNWILERQEESGDTAGILPPMIGGINALLLEGFTIDGPEIRKGLEAIERFAWQDRNGKRIQASISPVWDTVLMICGLCDAGVDPNNEHLRRAVKWTKAHQLLEAKGDWTVYNPKLASGGFSFQGITANSRYPDVDDTAVAILAFVKQDPVSVDSTTVARATNWICGMQNSNGGWAAFDFDNNHQFLNKLPFNDMGHLCDPSTADITGRILEAFGLMIHAAHHEHISPDLLHRIKKASDRGITWLAKSQESFGGWYGRWGSNYIYGTSNALCGLAYFADDSLISRDLIAPAVDWLKLIQNDDGGWGEDLLSYKDLTLAGKGESTASQTAWALMGLLAHVDPTDESVRAGVTYLTDCQTKMVGQGATWSERIYTGIGFPNQFYMGYTLYSHYFPMMALGRYVKAMEVIEEKKIHHIIP